MEHRVKTSLQTLYFGVFDFVCFCVSFVAIDADWIDRRIHGCCLSMGLGDWLVLRICLATFYRNGREDLGGDESESSKHHQERVTFF